MTPSEASGRETPPPPHSPNRAFVDRERELGELLEAVDDAIAGRGRLFLVSGEPGIGKTALALEFAEQAVRRGGRIVWGRCREGGGAPAYWPWIQVIRALMRGRSGQDVSLESGAQYLRQIVPEIFGKLPIPPPATGGFESLESDNDRFYLFDAVGGLLRDVARGEPLVLVLDDLHWADSSSLLLLRFIAGELQDSSLLIVAMYRETEARRVPQTAEMLGELARIGSRLTLQGLEPPEISSMIARTAGVTAPGNLVNEIHRMTRGNPFFIDELVRLLAAEGRLGNPRALAAAELKIPEGVRQLIRRRMVPISGPCREVLAVAAVIGREFPLALLAAVSGLEHDQLPEKLAEAMAADVVEESEVIGLYRFTHALIRETLYGELPHSRRLSLHWRVGGMLEQLYAANLEPYVTDLAFHYMRATPIGSVAKATRFAIRAGKRAAERLAYEEAADYFAQALESFDVQADTDPGLRCEVLLDLGDAQRKSGNASAAAASFERAADLAMRIGSADRFAQAALRWGGASGPLGETHDVTGRLNRGQIAVLEKALVDLPPADGTLHARLLGRLASALYWDTTADERRAQLSADALAMARRLGDPGEIAAALTAKRVATWGVDDLEQRLVEMNEAIRLAEQVGDRERSLQCRLWRIGDLLELGDAYGAEIEIDVYTRIAESLRQPLFLSYAAMLRALRALLHGRFAEAEAQSGEALRLGLLAQHTLASVSCGTQMFRIWWERGAIEMLEAALAGIRAQAEIPVTRCGLALVLGRVGKIDAARAELAELARDGFAAVPKDMTWLPAIAVLAEVCALVGDRAHAERLYDMLSPYAGRIVIVGPPVADCFGPVDGYLAPLAATVGRTDVAIAHFEAALRQSLAMGALPLAADLWCRYAKLLMASGNQEAAVELVRQSLEVADSLGMKRVADQARALQASLLAARPSAATAPELAVLQRRGDYWSVSFAGKTSELKDSLGLHYLAHLLRHPHSEFHVMDLAALSARDVVGDDREAKLERELADRSIVDLGHAGELLDARAKSEYMSRLEQLREELEAAPDAARAAELEQEIAFLDRELSSAYGLGGRARRGADVAERVRKAVTNRIRDALTKLQSHNPALGALLMKSVKMGSFCTYSPDVPLTWLL